MTSPFEELNQTRDEFFRTFSDNDFSTDFIEINTEIYDNYFRRSLSESPGGRKIFNRKMNFAFLAVGGYGRKELCLHSDIDILILFEKKVPSLAKELVEDILYPLWDLGLELGYGTRSVKDCLSLSKSDFEVLTSMMDARFICGDSPLFLSLMDKLQSKIISKKADVFSEWLQERDSIRMDTFGDASYLLEPNIKEGIGGLRDYHHMLWLAKALFNTREPRDLEYSGILTQIEYQELKEHLDFIWLVRNNLHSLSGRHNDRLGFEFQEPISKKLDYVDKEGYLAVEQFMGKLHSSMASIKSAHRAFVNSHVIGSKKSKKTFQSVELPPHFQLKNGEVEFVSATDIPKDPVLLMGIFGQSAHHGFNLSLEAKRLVREFLFLIDEEFRESGENVNQFLRIIGSKNTFETLDEMLETRFLSKFIPEFDRIIDRVQFDEYHTFPVARHSLETVRHLKSLSHQKDFLLLDILSELSNPEPLFLAGLFHDIGKVGQDHAKKGADITQKLLERFDYDENLGDEILFLVRYHLLLVETATRRDLNDEKSIVQCARTIESVERLKMLYLLTWADSKATGPRAWNEWIGNLVQELFFKILRMLEKGDLATADASQKVQKTKSKIESLMSGKIDETELNYLFEVMSPRYLLNNSPLNIIEHFSMVSELKDLKITEKSAAFVLNSKEGESGDNWLLTFVAMDRPGLFSDMAGVLAMSNINILSADIYTWSDGTVVDIFRVTNPLDNISPEKTWERVEQDLSNTLRGKLSLPYGLNKKSQPTLFSSEKRSTRPTKIVVDNDSSDFFTLVEVFSDDRIGLLYLITRTLFDLRLDIKVAKIGTKGDQTADVFYVRDLEGQKVEDPEQVKEIKSALIHELFRG